MRKSERHKIYKKALETLKNSFDWPYICSHIRRHLTFSATDVEIANLFPEFAKQKPEVIETDRSAWWDTDMESFEIRKNVLKKCIKLTKPKSNVVSRRKTVVKRPSLHKSSKGNRRVARVGRTLKK